MFVATECFRLQKIREAREALTQQARENAATHVEQMESEGRNHRTDPEAAVPESKVQGNFTDPDSKIMKTSNQRFDQCGNAQVITDGNQVILAADVTNQANNASQAEPGSPVELLLSSN